LAGKGSMDLFALMDSAKVSTTYGTPDLYSQVHSDIPIDRIVIPQGLKGPKHRLNC
jgi:hypothetical protein